MPLLFEESESTTVAGSETTDLGILDFVFSNFGFKPISGFSGFDSANGALETSLVSS
jgi:hypothetical protein